MVTREVTRSLGELLTCLAILGGLTGCGSNEVPPNHRLEPPAWNLPNPPQGALPSRDTATTVIHEFYGTDQVVGAGASWELTELTLQPDGLTYSIVGTNVGENEPRTAMVGGSLSGLWLAVSDYDTGTWHWLGGGHDEGWTEELPAGGWVNEMGEIYFAAVCPDGAQAQVTLTFTSETPPPTDIDPPVWELGDEGISSVDTSVLATPVIEWYPATDVESPPVTYLIYFAPTTNGIDWEDPQLLVSAEFTSTSFFTTEDPSSYDYAVRARDAAGNVTTNQNFISSPQYEYFKLPIVDWEAGDRFEMSWLDESVDSMPVLIGPGYLEGWPGEPDMLEGIVEFSPDSADSGLALEWARLLEDAPAGPYFVELHMGHYSSAIGETYTMKLFDASDSLKQDLGNFTVEPNSTVGLDYIYLRHGAQSWPQDDSWEAGDRLEITWDDAGIDLSLFVEDPMYRQGSPAYPQDLDGLLEFSADSEDSGEAVEWIKLLDTADGGLYTFWIDGWGSDIVPDPLPVTVTLYDSDDQPKSAPCSAETYQDYPEVYPLYWLDFSP